MYSQAGLGARGPAAPARPWEGHLAWAHAQPHGAGVPIARLCLSGHIISPHFWMKNSLSIACDSQPSLGTAKVLLGIRGIWFGSVYAPRAGGILAGGGTGPLQPSLETWGGGLTLLWPSRVDSVTPV